MGELVNGFGKLDNAHSRYARRLNGIGIQELNGTTQEKTEAAEIASAASSW
jgi:hypothetical protein